MSWTQTLPTYHNIPPTLKCISIYICICLTVDVYKHCQHTTTYHHPWNISLSIFAFVLRLMSTNIANKTWEPIICIWGEVHFLTVSSKIIVTQDGDRGSIGENRNREENINDLHWLFFGQNHHLQYDTCYFMLCYITGLIIIYGYDVFKDKDM